MPGYTGHRQETIEEDFNQGKAPARKHIPGN